MLFNSIAFCIFFPCVLIALFSVPTLGRRYVLLAASVWFYMVWKPVYILVLLVSIVVAYFTAIFLERIKSPSRKKTALVIAVVLSSVPLIIFKYLGFFASTCRPIIRIFDPGFASPVFHLAMPLGISFFTFKLLSYIIDVYRGTTKAERNFCSLALYASFFPQVLAGPITRAPQFLPQINTLPGFDATLVSSGLKRMLWGLFTKVVVADNLAVLVDQIYGKAHDYSGATLIIATYLYAFQILCDFSGYSDMAIGAARVMGITTPENFRRPYHAVTVADFWRRWHISLSSWFRDYLYIPLGGNRLGPIRWIISILIVFLVSGLWHGAAWTFVLWGGLHGLYLISEKLTHPLREKVCRMSGLSPGLRKTIGIVITFHLVVFAWIFFRAANLNDAFYIITHLATGIGPSFSTLLETFPVSNLIIGISGFALMETVHLIQRKENTGIARHSFPAWIRWAGYIILALAIINLQPEIKTPFLYMQF